MADSIPPRPSGTFTVVRLKAFAEELREQAMRSHEMEPEELRIYDMLVRATHDFLATHKPMVKAKTLAEAMKRIMDAVRPTPPTREEKRELIRKLESDEPLTHEDVALLERVEPEEPVQEDFTDRVMEKLQRHWEKEKD